MIIWKVIYQNFVQPDIQTTYWDDYVIAKQHICALIVDRINDNWDLTCAADVKLAEEIENLIKSGMPSAAINLWNSIPNQTINWTIEEITIYNGMVGNTISKINFPIIKSTEDNTSSENIQTELFVAADPGATCRTCQQYSEYSYADRKDMTYLCHQCKTFQYIFGA